MSSAPGKTTTDTDGFGKLKYLVIDDFENFRISMRHMLRSCGADDIELASHAKPAVQYCTYNHVDVVLCDYNLGDGTNGQHILEELRYKKLLKRSSLFLMVTSEASREIVMGAREYQPDAYLTKPINRAMLAKRLGGLISQRNALLPINHQIDLENYPKAISLCIAALPRLPRYKTWLMKTLGELYFLLGDHSHAIKVYDDVIASRELSWASLGRSRVLLANHRYDEAVESLRRLIANHPDYMEAYDLLAEGLERQNRTGQAQKVLEQALAHSPNALLRQKHLAELANSNQDMKVAAEAWRHTARLGAHSIHDSPDNYLALANTLCDLSEGINEADAEKLVSEAFSSLTVMEKQFPNHEVPELRSLITQCRIHASQGNTEEAETILEQARAMRDTMDTPELETELDFTKTLFRLHHTDEAKKLLGQLAEKHRGDPVALKKIDSLLDEPVGFRMKLKARRLNREGIAAFESGNLKQAHRIFSKALEIIPDHPALNLNQVQVLMKENEKTTNDRNLMERCQYHLDRLTDLPEQHGQYRRYQALLRKLKERNQ